MSLDRQSAAAAERRRAELAIQAIKPPRTTAPSRIHSQMRLAPELVPDAEPDEAAVGAGVVTDGVEGAAVTVVVEVTGTLVVAVTGTLVVAVTGTLGRAEAVAVLLGRLPTALLTLLPHPAAKHPTARRAAGRRILLEERRMLILRIVDGQPLDLALWVIIR